MNYLAKPPEDKHPTDIDWARLAAYIDGEGCLSIQHTTSKFKNGKRTYENLRIGVYNTDRRLTDWCKDVFGGCVRARPARPNCRVAHEWRCDNALAGWVITNCLPYMIIKQEQATICLKFWEIVRAYVATRVARMPDGKYPSLPVEYIEARQALKAELHIVKHWRAA